MMASNCNIMKDDVEFLNVNLNMKILKPLDDILRCRICFDYFNNCMITKCSHNYCSVCIRRYMLYKSQCPTCFQEASEPELRNNRLIDEILHVYKKMKESIENSECITQEEKFKIDNPVPVRIKKEISTADEVVQDKSERISEKDTSEVSCPVCYKRVLSERINVHLDACLKAEERERALERRILPKLVYHLLSDKEIKKKLKEHGLNTAGDRQTLIRRHKNFIVLYNANCDSLDPKPVTDLVRELEEQEIEERLNSLPRQTQVHKKSDMETIEREHASHVKKHQAQFNALIEDVQQRELNRIIKDEVYDDYSQNSESIIGNRSDHYGNFTSEKEEENKSSEHKSTPSHQSTKTPYQIQDKDDRSEPISKKVDKDIILLPSKDIKQELDSPLQENDDIEYFKSKENFEDSLTSSPSPVDDHEIGKIQLSKYRKRKKGRMSLGNRQCSPKKK